MEQAMDVDTMWSTEPVPNAIESTPCAAIPPSMLTFGNDLNALQLDLEQFIEQVHENQERFAQVASDFMAAEPCPKPSRPRRPRPRHDPWVSNWGIMLTDG